MWKRVKGNLESGLGRVKWFSSVLNDRVKVEISLLKLLYRSSEMEKKRNELLTKIGERVYELRNGPDKQVLRDPAVIETLKSVEAIDAEIEEVRRKAAEICGVEP